MVEALQFIIYFIFLFVGMYALADSRYQGTPYKSTFLKGYIVKVFGGLAFGAIYAFYYKGGDTLNYFHDCSVFYNSFVSDPITALKIIFNPIGQYQGDYYQHTIYLWFYDDTASFMVIRVIGLITVLGLNNFWITTMLVATFSYLCVWSLYRSLCLVYPTIKTELAIAILFMPSVFFWGSGIMKDTVTMSFLTVLLTQLIRIVRKKISITTIPITVFCFVILTIVKAYVVACLIPAILMFVIIKFRSSIANSFVRRVITPLFLSFSVAGSVLLLNAAEQYLGKFALNRFDQTVESYVWWHSKVVMEYQGGQGSHYSLGNVGGGISSLLLKFPLAVNVSLFRPYIWEVKNVVMLLTAVESLFVLVLTLVVFKRYGISNVLSKILKYEFVGFTMVYALLFSFAVGIASNNFGALARYKIPGLVMYMVSIYLIDFYCKQEKLLAEKR